MRTLSTLVSPAAGGDRGNDSQSDASGRSRREFLAGAAALGLTAVTPVKELIAQITALVTKRGLIDVHHHFVPPFYFMKRRLCGMRA